MLPNRSTLMNLILISIVSMALDNVVCLLSDDEMDPAESSNAHSDDCSVGMVKFCGCEDPTPLNCAYNAILYYHDNIEDVIEPVLDYIKTVIFRNIIVNPSTPIPTIEDYCRGQDASSFFQINSGSFLAEYGPSEVKKDCYVVLEDFEAHKENLLSFAFGKKFYQTVELNDNAVVTRKKELVNGYLKEIAKRIMCGGDNEVLAPLDFCLSYNTTREFFPTYF